MQVEFAEANQTSIHDILEMMQNFNAMFDYPFDRVRVANNLSFFVHSKHLGQIWTIHNENLIIGYLVMAHGFSFEYGGRDAFIDEFYLKQSFRSMGIGKMALDFVSTQAQRLNIKAIHLEVELENAKAQQLYLKNGFVDNRRTLLTKRL